MEKFKSGNVIKTPSGGIEIVTRVDSKLVHTIPLDFEAATVSHSAEDYVENCQCFCDEGNGGQYDPDCEDCKGTGSYKRERFGYNRSKLLARTVKEYILKSLTKNFGW